MRPRWLATIRPRPRQRDLTTDTARAHEHRVPGPALDEQHRQPLATQRVKGMRDDYKTQIVTGRSGTMPPPSGPPSCAAPRPPWGSSPAALGTAGTRQTSAGPRVA